MGWPALRVDALGYRRRLGCDVRCQPPQWGHAYARRSRRCRRRAGSGRARCPTTTTWRRRRCGSGSSSREASTLLLNVLLTRSRQLTTYPQIQRRPRFGVRQAHTLTGRAGSARGGRAAVGGRDTGGSCETAPCPPTAPHDARRRRDRRLERDRRGGRPAAGRRAGGAARPRGPSRGAAAGARRGAARPHHVGRRRSDRRRRSRPRSRPRLDHHGRLLAAGRQRRGVCWRATFAEGGYANVRRDDGHQLRRRRPADRGAPADPAARRPRARS